MELSQGRWQMGGKTFRVGRLFGILVEKNAELPGGHTDRNFLGTRCFQRTSKAAYAFGFFRSHDMQQADARQAYTQSLLGGTPTWVRLPREEWPESWEGLHDPAFPLRLALYGHPGAGGYGKKHCEAH
eukprot:3929791-Pyramimonas_sp.AAC.1